MPKYIDDKHFETNKVASTDSLCDFLRKVDDYPIFKEAIIEYITTKGLTTYQYGIFVEIMDIYILKLKEEIKDEYKEK